MELRFKPLAKQAFEWIIIAVLFPIYCIGIVFSFLVFGILHVMYAFLAIFLVSLCWIGFGFKFLKLKFTRHK